VVILIDRIQSKKDIKRHRKDAEKKRLFLFGFKPEKPAKNLVQHLKKNVKFGILI
jgi:hypothetical protein